MKGLGVCEWSLPLKDEALFAWMKENGVDNVSIGFDYAATKTEESYKAWCDKYMALSEKYQIPFSILAVNDLCTWGMNKKEQEETVKDILLKAVKTAALIGAPAIHMPSFGEGEIRSEEELEQVICILQYACRLGEEYHIQVGYESPLGAKELEHVLEEVHGDTFYMLFDNENVSLRGIDPVALYEKFAGLYTHTHVKAGSAEAAPRPLSSEESFGGLTKLAEVMRQHGFDGWVIIESDYWKLEKSWEEIFRQDKKFILESWK